MKWVAELSGVLDLTLVGTGDLSYWTDRLAPQRLTPLAVGGRAQMMVVAASAKFRGLRFQELSISVIVEGGAYLVRAFNSRRFLAFCERVFFHTPYAHAHVSVSDSRAGVDELFLASRAAREPSSIAAGGWTGRVFLDGGRCFEAAIAGSTERYPFSTADTLLIDPSLPRFTPDEWLVRRDATHAKSRTYRVADSS